MQIEGAFEEKDFRAKVTREEFEQMCADLLKRVPGPVEQALKSSAIPLVREKYKLLEAVCVKTNCVIFDCTRLKFYFMTEKHQVFFLWLLLILAIGHFF